MIQNSNAERDYWNKVAATDNVKDDYIIDATVSDIECVGVIAPFINSGLIVELGCGIGRLLRAMHDNERLAGSNFCGIDISAEMLQQAVALGLPDNVDVIENDGSTIPFADDIADSIYSMGMFQHITSETKARYIAEAERTLKPGGVFRFQYVEGEGAEFMKHDALIKDIYLWCAEAGLKITQTDYDLIKPRGTWVTAVKP